ncbi:hypothetical protein HanPSC8_Chr02g0073671 [Helianthus annuus]|nr:hypothetical protein HanPSC8_Chr08g0323411 [Helianthus annuus]KAJ0952560.1 hypothetical protein HanPSC8_Chr02g0073671 [Helianthus annuus]
MRPLTCLEGLSKRGYNRFRWNNRAVSKVNLSCLEGDSCLAWRNLPLEALAKQGFCPPNG